MPSREDEFWASRQEEQSGQQRRPLCPYCGSTRVVYKEKDKCWLCLNEDCQYYGRPQQHVSGGTSPNDQAVEFVNKLKAAIRNGAQSTDERKSALFTGICPMCNKKSNFKLSKRENSLRWLIIPIFSSTKYSATCDYCGKTFDVSEEDYKRFEAYHHF